MCVAARSQITAPNLRETFRLERRTHLSPTFGAKFIFLRAIVYIAVCIRAACTRASLHTFARANLCTHTCTCERTHTVFGFARDRCNKSEQRYRSRQAMRKSRFSFRSSDNRNRIHLTQSPRRKPKDESARVEGGGGVGVSIPGLRSETSTESCKHPATYCDSATDAFLLLECNPRCSRDHAQ